jgi:hypothetical protein
MGAADGGMLEAPLWLKLFAVLVVIITLPFAHFVGAFVLWSYGPLGLVLAFLVNSLLLAALLRWTHIWIRGRRKAAVRRSQRHW